MAGRNESLRVAVESQVLWIGTEAYPVHNIARANTISLKPRRGRAVARFLGLVVLWTLVAFVSAIAIDSLVDGQDAESLTTLPFVVGAVLVLINFISMIRTLARRNLYALVIETSGSPHSVLVTEDEEQLRVIVQHLTEAINNPQASFGPITVQNFKVGKAGIIGDNGRIGTVNT